MQVFKWIDSYFFLEDDKESEVIRPYFYTFVLLMTIVVIYIFIAGK